MNCRLRKRRRLTEYWSARIFTIRVVGKKHNGSLLIAHYASDWYYTSHHVVLCLYVLLYNGNPLLQPSLLHDAPTNFPISFRPFWIHCVPRFLVFHLLRICPFVAFLGILSLSIHSIRPEDLILCHRKDVRESLFAYLYHLPSSIWYLRNDCWLWFTVSLNTIWPMLTPLNWYDAQANL